MSVMRSKSFAIKPSTNLKQRIASKGSVVVCKGGAIAGSRIHFDEPSLDTASSDNGEPLIDGAAYTHPDGEFHEFWITFPTQVVANYEENTKLLVVSCATPVLVLNDPRLSESHYSYVAGGSSSLWEVASSPYTLYDEGPATTASEKLDATKGVFMDRGFIGGGFEANNPVRVIAYGYVDGGGVDKYQLCSWDATAADFAGKYSFALEYGGKNSTVGVGTQIRNGSTFLPWPPLGLRLDVVAISADITDAKWFLYRKRRAT